MEDELEEIPVGDASFIQPEPITPKPKLHQRRARNKHKKTENNGESKDKEAFELPELRMHKPRRSSWVAEETPVLTETGALNSQFSPPPPMSPPGEDELALDQSTKTDDDEERSVSRASASLDLSMSMRDRLRIKAKSAVTKTREKARITRRLSRTFTSSRLEPQYSEQDVEAQVKEALERSKELRRKIDDQATPESKMKLNLPNAQEQFDFFTKCYEESARGISAPTDIGEELEQTEETTLLRKQEYKTEEQIQSMTKAIATPYFVQVSKESKIYFIPSFLPAPRALKREGDLRNLEEEGLYTGTHINVPERNVNVMEQRLLNQPDNGRGWFGDDGNLISMTGGLANFPMQPEYLGDNLAVYRKAEQGRRAQSDGLYQLDVDISKLLFTHHQLFSKENVLSSRLMDLYRNYLRRSEENLAEYYDTQMRAMKNSFAKISEQNEIVDEHTRLQDDKLCIIRKEIRELRKKRNTEEMLDRKLIQQMLDTWSWLKELRTRQRYSVTSFNLLIKKVPVNINEDHDRWTADLKEELEEAREDFQLWVQQQDTAGNVTVHQFDSRSAWNQIQSTAIRTRRNPGEPKLIPLVASTNPATLIDQCPDDEKRRRNEIGKTKLCLKIYFNELEVCSTVARQLNADFCVSFGQIYTLHVYEWPQTIKIKVFESTAKSGWKEISQIGLPIPKSSQISTPGASSLEEMEFSSHLSWNPQFNGVGSGMEVNFEIDGCPPVIPRTSGVLQCAAVWGRAKDGTPLVPPGQPTSVQIEQKLQNIGPKNLSAIKQLQELLKESKFDPNDPVNSHLLALLQDIETSASAESGAEGLARFRLEPEECALMSEAEFNADQRFKLLELRREGVPEFKNMKMIPPYAKQVDHDVFKSYEKRLEKDKEGAKASDMDGLRDAGNKYLTMVRHEVMQRLYSAQLSKSIEDVVSEEPIPSFSALGLMIIEEPGRPLKPVRREAKRVATQNLTGGQVKILINVQSASNVPSRIQHGKAEEDPHGQRNQVESFLEATFQGSSAKTSVVPGTRPTWNQHLALEFRAPNEDYSTTNLQTVNDVIYFNLFDQVVTGLTHDDREEGHTIHEQVERRWLGSMELPFSTLYFNGKIDGSLRLKVPPVFLGYNVTHSDVHGAQNLAHPYVKLLVAIEPQLTTPDAIQGKFESIESEDLVKYCDIWARDLESRFPKRRYLPLVLDTNGRTVLIIRFLKALAPPPDIETVKNEDMHRAADMACRLVSLIPFVADPVLFPGMCDIWSTCDQFLNMLCGDEEEHAVLLWCWLTGLGFRCYLVIGNGLPEGPRSAYVLVRAMDHTRPDMLYNAADGTAYSVNDPYCPLHVVGCIVDQNNIWGNTQQQEHPSMVNFDVGRAGDWKPLFTRDQKFSSIQPESLDYTDTDPGSVTELKGSLEREIKQRFDKWRQHGIPSWNFHAGKTLRDMLPLLEFGSLDSEEHTERLKPLTDSYKLSGFPLNMGYESKEKVIEAVKATNVHLNFNPGVEFALAVHVHPYANNILSVWVYVASLIKLR